MTCGNQWCISTSYIPTSYVPPVLLSRTPVGKQAIRSSFVCPGVILLCRLILTLLLRFTVIVLAIVVIQANVVNRGLADIKERIGIAFSSANCFAALSLF